jgi:glycosyltransferase involved in cell wall biosynthesis
VGRRIVICLSHSIEEYDQIRLLTSLGHEVFSIGGYINPREPHDDKRPALQAPAYPALQAVVDALGTADNLGAAQSQIPAAILEWADTIIYHHYLDRLYGQWPRIKDWLDGDSNRRVIWRTVGQSVDGNEHTAQPFRAQGMEILRYSPKERNIPGYAGEDGLIRFYKDPDEWKGWNGSEATVIQVTQHLRQRDPYTNWGFWEEATKGLDRTPLGPGSEAIGGPGSLTYDEMKAWLRNARVYLYTGTQPASYTLGLIEAMMTGIPVVSIGPSHMQVFPYGSELFEGHELASGWTDYPETAAIQLRLLLDDHEEAARVAEHQRSRAIELFGIDTIREQWRAFLS